MSDGPTISVSRLSDWPDDHLQRAYRLSVVSAARLRSGEVPPDPELLDDLATDAERFGVELCRRGLL
jgi:hypothetical protein